ncbi:hypothetical protein JL722_13374 [Aureococcus anophagefferens]|nr:hypothetical protein JL722_13374 [Aureococcus anophagefferens]
MADDDAEETVVDGSEASEEEEALSDSEKLAIVQHFLLQAPPGEYGEVLKDASQLVDDGVLSAGMLAGIARTTRELFAIPRPFRRAVFPERHLPTQARRCGRGRRARDPLRRERGRADALRRERVGASEVDHAAPGQAHEPPPPEEAPEADEDDAPPDDDDDAEAAAPSREAPRRRRPGAGGARASPPALAAAIGAYVAGHYGGRGSRDLHHAVYALDGALAVAIRGDKVNLRNFYAGGWASTWTAAVDGAGYAVSGSVRVRAHYFEDGNVQLQSAKTVEAAKCADVAAVAALVEETEGALQRGLEDMYENMSAETFKAMRRVMPISRQKMKWNINEIALKRGLSK